MSDLDNQVLEAKSKYDFSEAESCVDLPDRIKFCEDFLRKYKATSTELVEIKEESKKIPQDSIESDDIVFHQVTSRYGMASGGGGGASYPDRYSKYDDPKTLNFREVYETYQLQNAELARYHESVKEEIARQIGFKLLDDNILQFKMTDAGYDRHRLETSLTVLPEKPKEKQQYYQMPIAMDKYISKNDVYAIMQTT